MFSSARPHADDQDLARAAARASSATDGDLQDVEVQKCTVLAIKNAQQAIDGGLGAAKGEELLVAAVRSAEEWVRFACRGSRS